MKKTTMKNIAELNLSLIIISSAAIFARFIELDPTVITFWRSGIAFLVLGGFMFIKKSSFKISNKKDNLLLLVSSLLFALHWVTYFYALQISSVAIGMLSLFTFPVIYRTLLL